MPIYEYACTACEHELEAIQKMSEAPLEFCPECGEKTLKKQLSAAAFQLKGSGWYETDFKNGGKSKAKGDAKPAETQPNVKSNSKPEAKPKHSCGGGGCGCAA